MTPREIPDDERVGTALLFANDVVRVWEMCLAPGESSPLHRHGCDYIIAYTNELRAEIFHGGEHAEAQYGAGYVEYFPVGREGSEVQQLTNIGGETHRHFVIELLERNQAAPRTNNAGRRGPT